MGSSDVTVVVFTGGPCAGKSSILPIAKQWLEDRGYIVAVLPEVATELIGAGFDPFLPWDEPLDFQRHLMRYQIDREDRYGAMLKDMKSGRPRVLLCDRGALDSMAYIGRDLLETVATGCGSSWAALLTRYDLVVHLTTAARGAAQYYTLANNAARRESAQVAADLDEKTEEAWLGHPHHIVVDNRTDWKGKVRRALAALARVLHVPEPKEVERKFVCALGPKLLPGIGVEIVQTYLVAADGGERRVRRRWTNGHASFFYTEKRETETPGVRIEREREITEEEYEALLLERDPACERIVKTRFAFVYQGQQFELDWYREGRLTDRWVLEAEVEAIDAPLGLPPWLELTEVTGDKRYSNKALSRDGWPDDLHLRAPGVWL